jgi:hypothetical protein
MDRANNEVEEGDLEQHHARGEEDIFCRLLRLPYITGTTRHQSGWVPPLLPMKARKPKDRRAGRLANHSLKECCG